VGCNHFTASKHINETRARLWRTQAAKVADTLAAIPGPVLVGGDFNATPDSGWMRPIAAVATVNADPAPRAAASLIDHVWGRAMRPVSAALLPRLGSDHRPVLTVWTRPSQARA
jgi:endonuclease/exonuclease/phosphatase (EEP) superfamily protein YafD